jgi:ribokinase
VLNPAPADAPTTILLKLADVITPNETEFAALLGRHVGERVDANDVAALDGARLHALCRKLVGNGSGDAGRGGRVRFAPEGRQRGDAQPHYRVGAEQVQAIDTTGAGDAFNGALAASLARWPRPHSRHVRFANQFAARSTERAGAALAMPRLAELDVTV